MSRASELLIEAARRRDFHHAVLLHGPSRKVLGSLALRIAKTLNCLSGATGDECPSCSRIERAIHPDVHRITIEDERSRISVEQARSVVASASLRPYEGAFKVYIIDPADAMNLSAANALLKTLEEPAGQTVFLLLTRSPDLLPITIRSRAQSIYIAPEVGQSSRQLAEKESRSLESAWIQQRDSLESGFTARESESLALKVANLLGRYAAKRETTAILSLASLIASFDRPQDSAAIAAVVLRDLVALDPADSIAPEQYRAVQTAIPRETLLDTAELLLLASNRLAVNADARLMMERALITLCEIKNPGPFGPGR